MKTSIIKHFPTTCTFCGGRAIEYHYSDGNIGSICFGDCYNVINRAKKTNENICKIFKAFVFLTLFVLPTILIALCTVVNGYFDFVKMVAFYFYFPVWIIDFCYMIYKCLKR